MTTTNQTTYKVLMNPANVSVTGKNNYHALRSNYNQDERTVTLADGLSKADAEEAKKLLNEYTKDPNCRPELWIASEKVNDVVKNIFINALTK